MTDTTQSFKYQCGCGKAYNSYPAFSTHKRLKHHNQTVRGTQLPQQYIPKRGRPSFAVPNQPTHTDLIYSAMTTLQVGLLKLEQKYSSLLSDPNSEADMTILDIFVDCEKEVTCKTGQYLVESIKKFTEVIVNHSNELLGQWISKFMLELTIFLVENITVSQVQLQWQQASNRILKLESHLFNSFFQRKGQMERLNMFAKTIDKPLMFLLELTVYLSYFLSKMGLVNGVLCLRK